MAKWLTIVLLFLTFAASAASNSEITVFSVNKTLSMGPKDPVYRDYYLNGGLEVGFRRGMLVTVVRRIPVHDLSRNKSLGDLRVPVARLKLVYVNKTISVGRVEKIVKPVNLPATEFASVMVGDMIVLGDGLEDLGRMDDLDGDEGQGTGAAGSAGDGTTAQPTENQNGKPAEANTATDKVLGPEVAAIGKETTKPQTEVPKPTPVDAVPEKNAEKPDLSTQVKSSEKPKKSSAKAADQDKKPLKSPVKPVKSAENAIVGPAS